MLTTNNISVGQHFLRFKFFQYFFLYSSNIWIISALFDGTFFSKYAILLTYVRLTKKNDFFFVSKNISTFTIKKSF